MFIFISLFKMDAGIGMFIITNVLFSRQARYANLKYNQRKQNSNLYNVKRMFKF